jgi:nitroreductase
MGTAGYAHQIPALIVVIGDFSCFEHERDRHVPYIDGSLATMQLMLSLETLGLASCPINWPDIEHLERRMAARLHLEPFHRPIMLLALGYPDPTGGIAYSAKKTSEQIQRPQSALSDR